jgi:hypothetical protein
LLLRLGADAEVLEPDDLIDARAVVAKQALARYRRTGGEERGARILR